MNEYHTGTVASLVAEKGYGFLEVAGFDRQVFFHAKDCVGVRIEQLRKGDSVSIGSIVDKERGKSAKNVALMQ